MAHRTGRAAAVDLDPVPFVRGLRRLAPPERLDEVLRRTGRKEGRRCRLPAHAVCWLLVAMALFPDYSVPKAFRALHPSGDGPDPDDSTFVKARRRLGVAPLREMFRQAAAGLAPDGLPGTHYRRWRLMGIDGTTFNLADTPENDRAFGRPKNQRSPGAFPQVRVLALCELGTRQVADFAYRPIRHGEQSMVGPLLRRLGPGMLLLWDRNFFGHALLAAVKATGCDLLARVKAGQLVFRRDEELPDGSYLSRVYASAADKRAGRGGLKVRIVEYTHDDPNRPGYGEKHRLLTTVLDPAELPAAEAPVVYHERWEQELSLAEIKGHLGAPEAPLRSKSPGGVIQELYGVMLAHRVVRQVVTDAAAAKKVDPDRLSFVGGLRVLRAHLPEAPARAPQQWYERLVREVGWQELRPRRERWYPRVVKRKMKKWDKKQPRHARPPQPTKKFREAVLIL